MSWRASRRTDCLPAMVAVVAEKNRAEMRCGYRESSVGEVKSPRRLVAQSECVDSSVLSVEK